MRSDLTHGPVVSFPTYMVLHNIPLVHISYLRPCFIWIDCSLSVSISTTCTVLVVGGMVAGKAGFFASFRYFFTFVLLTHSWICWILGPRCVLGMVCFLPFMISYFCWRSTVAILKKLYYEVQ